MIFVLITLVSIGFLPSSTNGGYRSKKEEAEVYSSRDL
jgi:hypothetical protein